MDTPTWRHAAFLELVDGYHVRDAAGTLAREIRDVHVACVGGFLHVSAGGGRPVQIVSAPAVRLVELTPEACEQP